MAKAKGLAHKIHCAYKKVCREIGKRPTYSDFLARSGITHEQVREIHGNRLQFITSMVKSELDSDEPIEKGPGKPKVLFFDIETRPMLSYHWDKTPEFIPFGHVKEDWQLLCFCAKWKGSKEIIFESCQKDKDDKRLLEKLRSLLDEADIVITKNGKKFDQKKTYARLIQHRIHKPSSFKHVDVEQIVRSNFGFSYNSLEALCIYLGTKYKKLKHGMFPGIDLWLECMKGNKAAWAEMKAYNTNDVLALEECYNIVAPYDNSINMDLFHDDLGNICPSCGGDKYFRNGFCYTSVGRYQRFKCAKCMKEVRGKVNLLSQRKKRSLKVPIK